MDDFVILPPDMRSTKGLPLIYLAGPIQGAVNWQREAVSILRSHGYKGWIASPRSTTISDDVSLPSYESQVDWEHYLLKKTFLKGVMLFWLACEAEHDPQRAYAQTTRFELGWTFRECEQDILQKKSPLVVLGIERGFTNERYIRTTFRKFVPHVPILNTLEETCKEAIALSLHRSYDHGKPRSR